MMDTQANSWNTSEEPIYNIGVVSRMTGIPVATLRVWERRYDFPEADRTAGGHRLYSEKELVRLRWVKANIDQGMQTSQAIRALHSRERDGRIPELATAPTAVVRPVVNGSALEQFHLRLTEALVNHDLSQADQLLAEIMVVYPLEDLILHVIGPTLVDLGEGWARGEINVATEHLASQYVRNRLMTWLITGPQARPVRPAVLACAPDEWHDVSLLMLGVLLRRRRWPIAYLGQSVPLPDLAKFVNQMRPPALVLVAMTEASARKLLELPRWLPEAVETGRPAITYGGHVFNALPGLQQEMAGTFLGGTIANGVDTLERILMETTGLAV